MNKQFKGIALIDTDFFIINYTSTITTYIQNLYDNLLKNENVGENRDGEKQKRFMDKTKIKICTFMLCIFLKAIEGSVDLFPLLHSIINKYHVLTFRKKTKLENGIEKGNGKNGGKNREFEKLIAKKSCTKKIKKGEREKEKEKEEEKEKGKEDEKKNNKKKLFPKDRIKNIFINLTTNNSYNNFANIKNSKLCSVELKKINLTAKKKTVDSKSLTESKKQTVNNKTLFIEHNGTKETTEKNDETKVWVENKKIDRETDYCKDRKYEKRKEADMEGDSVYSTYKLNETFPTISKKRFIINYNKVHLKFKKCNKSENFMEPINRSHLRERKQIKMDSTLKKKLKKKKVIKELYFMYRIIILSKLHIGAYNFLSNLKKKKCYCIFYSSNKKLTSFLFKVFNIKKKFKGCYCIVNSFEKIARLTEKNKCFVFSNRECFIKKTQKNGIFNVVKGNNSDVKKWNCDDINWDMIKWENGETIKGINEQEEKTYRKVDIHDVEIQTNSSNENIHYSKYNDVVYPFLKNCNLTEDILSWKLFYFFKKFIFVTGEVVKGFGRGSKYLNLPTANILNSDFLAGDIIPGIYFGFCKLKKKIYKTVISIGYNPYFKNKNMTIEAFIFYKTNEHFYKEIVHIVIMGMLRSESNFAYFSHLIHAIQFDCELTRIILKKIKNTKKVIRCKVYLNELK